jgi:hypothetical protein
VTATPGELRDRRHDVGFFLQTYAHVLKNDDREAAEQAAAFLIGDDLTVNSDRATDA